MLLKHGHTSEDLETGRVRIEDAFLLLEDMKELFNTVCFAETRLNEHFEREYKRKEQGLVTDKERYLSGQKISD